MKSLAKIIATAFLASTIALFCVQAVFAQAAQPRPAPIAGIIPNPGDVDCTQFTTTDPDKRAFASHKGFKNQAAAQSSLLAKREYVNKVLGCGIKTGKIRLYMLPYLVTYLIQFMLSLAGLAAVMFIVIGGYKYVLGGLTDDKESGKKVITNALIGLLVALSAWIIVNFIQVALTS